jgi:hypothetical protein
MSDRPPHLDDQDRSELPIAPVSATGLLAMCAIAMVVLVAASVLGFLALAWLVR